MEKGTEGMEQENSFSLLPPLTIALSSPTKRADAQVPIGISGENVRQEINLPANLWDEEELFY